MPERLALPGPTYSEEELLAMSDDFEAMHGGLNLSELQALRGQLRKAIVDAQYAALHRDAYAHGDYEYIKDVGIDEDGRASYTLSPQDTRGMRPLLERISATPKGHVVKTTISVEQLGARAPLFGELEWVHRRMQAIKNGAIEEP